jgi:hypothetical protein
MWQYFADELEKIAVVSSGMKQYRRALQLFPRNKAVPQAFHGVEPITEAVGGSPPVESRLQSILSGGELLPSSTGSHGPGQHTWKGQPLLTYMNRPDSTGIAVPLKNALDGAAEDLSKAHESLVRPHMVIRKGSLKLPPKQTTIIAPPETLRKTQGLFAKKKYRQVSSPIFNRAEADWRAMSHANAGRELYPEQIVRPGAKYLEKLRTGRIKPENFRKLRATTPDTVREFADDYLLKAKP